MVNMMLKAAAAPVVVEAAAEVYKAHRASEDAREVEKTQRIRIVCEGAVRIAPPAFELAKAVVEAHQNLRVLDAQVAGVCEEANSERERIYAEVEALRNALAASADELATRREAMKVLQVMSESGMIDGPQAIELLEKLALAPSTYRAVAEGRRS